MDNCIRSRLIRGRIAMNELKIGSIGVDLNSTGALCEIIQIIDQIVIYKPIRENYFFVCSLIDFWPLI
jgi:hypothetical protein